MPKQRIKQRSQQRSRQRDQSRMKPKTPVGVRERTNPSPRPQKPKSLDSVDREEKQRKEENSAKNQGNTPLRSLLG
jgi:hypothetical protein